MTGLSAAAPGGDAPSIVVREAFARPVDLPRWFGGVALLAGLYYGSAKVGFALEFSGPVAAVVWLPIGVAVAFLALFGLSLWPGALLGDLLANNYTVLHAGGAAGQTFGNLLEAVLAAFIVRRLMRAGAPLNRTSGVAGVVLACAAGTALSAVIGPLSLYASNALSGQAWGASLLAGMLGFAALFAFLAVMARLVPLPASAALTTPEGMPRITAFLLLTMSSIVAGVTEESAFRGYMQGPVERRYGLLPAILVNGIAFGLLHFPNHPGDVLLMLPYYIAVSAVYGGLTWAANSILPALVMHSGGDVWSLGRLWLTGRPEWQLSSAPAPLVSETGIDAGLLVAVGALGGLTALTIWAYASLHRLSSNLPASARSASAGPP